MITKSLRLHKPAGVKINIIPSGHELVTLPVVAYYNMLMFKATQARLK